MSTIPLHPEFNRIFFFSLTSSTYFVGVMELLPPLASKFECAYALHCNICTRSRGSARELPLPGPAGPGPLGFKVRVRALTLAHRPAESVGIGERRKSKDNGKAW